MQTVSSIPPWEPDGLLPPVDPSDPVSRNRSPYRATLPELVVRFGTSTERLLLLDGLLRYRALWHSAGLTRGFQWINGSFVEDKETLEEAPPRDIDIVTFFELPKGASQVALNSQNTILFRQDDVKSEFRVDTYWVVLDHSNMEYLIERTVYWSSLFAHTRQNQWKGFVEIDLAQQDEDAISREINARLNKEN